MAGYKDGEFFFSDNPIANIYRWAATYALPGEKPEEEVWDMLQWRAGLWLIAILLLIPFCKNHKITLLVPSLPLIGNLIIMILGLYHQSFRYVYFVQLCCITLWLLCFREIKLRAEHSEEYR